MNGFVYVLDGEENRSDDNALQEHIITTGDTGKAQETEPLTHQNREQNTFVQQYMSHGSVLYRECLADESLLYHKKSHLRIDLDKYFLFELQYCPGTGTCTRTYSYTVLHETVLQ